MNNKHLVTLITPFIALAAMAETAPQGALPGLFSVSATKTVQFAQGNLQYQASTNMWRFADHQWDCIGADNINISETYAGWIDLFGWGTSGYHDAEDALNKHYQPWDNKMEFDLYEEDNITGYGPSFRKHDIVNPGLVYYPLVGNVFANYDWGVYNTISNGGAKGTWRVLQQSEWIYLRDRQKTFEYKENPTDENYLSKSMTLCGMSTITVEGNNIYGLVLLPDNWTEDRDTWNGSAVVPATITDWANFEAKGAVFLPAAGYRGFESKSAGGEKKAIYEVNTHANYWTTSPAIGSSLNAFCLDAHSGNIELTSYNRFDGFAVRLVYTPQSETWITISDRPADEEAQKELLTAKKTDAKPVNVHLIRTLYSDGWNTLCLPFTLTNAEWKAAFGASAQVAKFTSATLSKGKDTLKISMTSLGANEEMLANMPYIIVPAADVVNPDFTSRIITVAAGSGETLPTSGENMQFLGIVNRTKLTPGGQQYLFVTATEQLEWPKLTDATRMYGLRAYFYVPDMLQVSFNTPARMLIHKATEVATSMDNAPVEHVNTDPSNPCKFLFNNAKIVIIRDGKAYSITGQEMEVQQ